MQTVRSVVKRAGLSRVEGTSEKASLVIIDYKAGLTLDEIGKKHSISQGSITKITKQAGLSRARATPVDKGAIIADYRLGVTIDNIVKKHGVSRTQVTETVKGEKRRITVPSHTAATPGTISKITSEYVSGASMRELAAKYGFGWKGIKKIVIKAGVLRYSALAGRVLSHSNN